MLLQVLAGAILVEVLLSRDGHFLLVLTDQGLHLAAEEGLLCLARARDARRQDSLWLREVLLVVHQARIRLLLGSQLIDSLQAHILLHKLRTLACRGKCLLHWHSGGKLLLGLGLSLKQVVLVLLLLLVVVVTHHEINWFIKQSARLFVKYKSEMTVSLKIDNTVDSACKNQRIQNVNPVISLRSNLYG